MSLVHRASFMQFRHELETSAKPASHIDFEKFKQEITSLLESTGLIVVNKVRRTERLGQIFDATAQWTGINPDPEVVAETILSAWPGKDQPKTVEQHIKNSEPDFVEVRFALSLESSRYLSGRVLVQI